MNAKSSYTLIWEVDSYTPIIEYNLWFRPYKPKAGLNKPDWIKLTVPTEHSSNTGPMYSKDYTIKGLKERTIYEALLVSRNRYGWSKPSPILRFATIGAGTYRHEVACNCLLIKISFFILDLKEEIITPVQTETENNMISLEISSTQGTSSANRKEFLYTSYLIGIILFVCF